MGNYVNLLSSCVLEHSVNEFSNLEHVLRLVVVLELMSLISEAPHRPVELRLRIAQCHKMLDCISKAAGIIRISNEHVTCTVYEDYWPSRYRGIIIFLTPEGPPREFGSIETVGLVITCIVEPRDKVGGEPLLVSVAEGEEQRDEQCFHYYFWIYLLEIL